MPYDETLADRVRTCLARRKNFESKKMFGGIGFLMSGNMCVGVWKEFLILRLGIDAAQQVLTERFVRPFDITGRAMRGWADCATPTEPGRTGAWASSAAARPT